jgi:hypothetical protein
LFLRQDLMIIDGTTFFCFFSPWFSAGPQK